MAGSFLGRLPSDLVDTLVKVGQRTDYPAGSTIYQQGRIGSAAPPSRVVARVSQQELADVVGSAREVVARVLQEFRPDRLRQPRRKHPHP